MINLKWIKIKGHGIEDIFASYNFTGSTFEVEGFKGAEGTYEISGDLPKNFPNPVTVTFSKSGGFSLSSIRKSQDQFPAQI